MKHRKAWLSVAVLTAGVAIFAIMRWQQPTSPRAQSRGPLEVSPPSSPEKQSAVNATSVPAHYEGAPSLTSLAATLPPDKFNGKTRDAYQAAREIPRQSHSFRATAIANAGWDTRVCTVASRMITPRIVTFA